MSISLNLVDADASIKKDIEKAMFEEISVIIDARVKNVKKRLQNLIPSWVESSPEVQSLRGGNLPQSLGAQIGLVPAKAESAINDIVNAISKSIEVKVIKGSKLQDIKINMSFQPSDFKNILAIPDASIVAEGGQSLEWINWLLFAGTKTIVYGFSYEPDTSFGRTGGGFMAFGGAWRIPPEFAGNDNNNFITRMFVGREKEISKVVDSIFAGL
jgi:hypothetical protein|tara:strand:+ start:1171 stop:1812 length:642 start_codon:yes stop_codon:yes gene_type:complete